MVAAERVCVCVRCALSAFSLKNLLLFMDIAGAACLSSTFHNVPFEQQFIQKANKSIELSFESAFSAAAKSFLHLQRIKNAKFSQNKYIYTNDVGCGMRKAFSNGKRQEVGRWTGNESIAMTVAEHRWFTKRAKGRDKARIKKKILNYGSARLYEAWLRV